MGANGEIVRALYRAFAEGDLPGVLGAFHEDIRWSEAEGFLYADGNPYCGPQAVAEGVFLRLATDVSDFTVHPESFVEGGDAVVVEGRYRGRAKATGKSLDAQFAHMWRLSEGRIVRFQQYTDTKQWAEAVQP